MRQARIKVMEETAVYHCISRVVGGQFLLDDPAKETFRLLTSIRLERTWSRIPKTTATAGMARR